MNSYDVIIVGGGPAGLKCAQTFIGSGYKVLLLEKESIFGDKLCAGGLTTNDMEMLDIPDPIIEHKISNTALFSRKRSSTTQAPKPFLFTVDRKVFGNWQKELLKGTEITVLINARVSRVDGKKVWLKDGSVYEFKYLVGADGYASLVRKYLGIPVKRKLTGIQYTIQTTQEIPRLEIHLDGKLFHSWYAWVFPHDNSLAIGCCSNPHVLGPAKLTRNFHKWLDRKGIDYKNCKLQSYPISYDFQGIQFGNIYLIGEAAGMASGLTGEGIYQSMVSGQEAARMILDPNYQSEPLKKVLRYNKIQLNILNFLRWSGPLKLYLHEFLLMMMNNRKVKAIIRDSFSPSEE